MNLSRIKTAFAIFACMSPAAMLAQQEPSAPPT